MNQGSLTERITRSLAYMLRHQPEEFDLELDENGYGDLGDIVCALNERLGEPVEDEDVVSAIDSGDRPRYEIVRGRIRALYGHSIHIEPGDPSEPPELLYVGVGSRDADRAEQYGLRGGRRTFLHLALTNDDAREAGRRIAPDYAVITVRAGDAYEDGYDFFDRKSLFLAESVPTDYIEVGEMHHDGVRRDDSRRDRGSRGGRDRGPRRDDDRSRDRDRAGRGRDREPARGRSDEAPRSSERAPREERPREERPREERPREAPRARENERTIEPRPRSESSEPSKPSKPAKAAKAGPGFGLGIFDPKAETKKDEAKPKKKRAPSRSKVSDEAKSADKPPKGGGGFGLGI